MSAIITPPEQQVNTYAVTFQIMSAEYPGTPAIINIYKNDVLLYTFNTTVGLFETYTFAEPTSDSVVYKIDGIANSDDSINFQQISEEVLTVLEFKPIFTLPKILCAKKGEPFIFFPTAWNMNSVLCDPNNPLDPQITYERYEFNMNTSQYELKGTPVILDMTGEDSAVTGSSYAYVPNGENSWIPDKLTMVKFVVKVQNCSTEIEKATVFPICGGWKIRRIACGNYRIYNYTADPITFTFTDSAGNPITNFPDKTIIPFSYDTLAIDVDGVYKITDDTATPISQYIFNYCKMESCVLDIQKKILLDDTLCDDCKMDKVLYQKAIRLLSVYETWKKLLDKDWVYNIQYASTDIDNELSRIYDAEELYKELIKFCEDCGDTDKKCNC
jgi:hypothetical protein